MYADLLRYYRVDLRDVVRGDHDPAHILALVEALPAGSATNAMRLGGDEWRYYHEIGPEYQLGASIFDAINQNTIATGMFKKKPKLQNWPMPEELAKKANEKKAPSVNALFGVFAAAGAKQL